MAHVSNIQLTVSVIGGGSTANKAEVKCTIYFTNYEVVADQNYLVNAILWEQDEARDSFVMKPDGYVAHHQSVGNRDDAVGLIGASTIQPNGNYTVDVILSREWNFPDLDDMLPSMERFFATVSVIPQLSRGDLEFSPIVDIDVG